MFGRKKQDERTKAEFLTELAAQRESAQSLVDRYEAEVKNSRSSVLAAGKAREERDEYRRVLAAAIATEGRREAQVLSLEQDQERLEALAHREMRAASEEAARVKELRVRLDRLEKRLTEELAARERAIGDVADRAWAEREAARDEFVRLVAAHRSEVSTSLETTAAELARLSRASGAARASELAPAMSRRPVAPDPLAMVTGLRARLLIGLSIVSTLAAVALIPLAVLAVSDPERALFVHLASGVGPWHLIALVTLFSCAAVGLLSWAIRDLRQPTPVEAASPPSKPKGPAAPPAVSQDTLFPHPKPGTGSVENSSAGPQRNPNAGHNGTPRP